MAAVYTGDQLAPAAAHMRRLANGAEAYLLVRPTWHGPEVLESVALVMRDTARWAPNIRFILAMATAEDDALCRGLRFDSIWCSHNAWLDERIYAPDLDAERLYDAVYVARLTPFKRHALAAKVPRLAILTGAFEVDRDYAVGQLAALSGLQFVNFSADRGVVQLPPDQVRAVLSQSGCGLALSSSEGAMYASGEYLLCGLPVVTTPSKGGRDVFFHPDYVETVEPDADAVAAGVARVLAQRLDPLEIRRRTLELIMPHRARLIGRLSQIAGRDLFATASDTLWLPGFSNKLEHWVETPDP